MVCRQPAGCFPGFLLRRAAAARPLVQRYGMGLKMAHGMLEIRIATVIGRRRFAQRSELRVCKTETLAKTGASSRPRSITP